MERQIAFSVPTLEVPCGHNLGLDLEAYARLGSAGVKRLKITGCQCGADEHLVDLPDLSTLETKLISTLVTNGPRRHV